jgi:hypothetical protein
MFRGLPLTSLALILFFYAPVYAKKPSGLPLNFKGKIVYVGSVETIITSPSTITPIVNHNITLQSKSNLETTIRSQGNYYTEIDYDGHNISGRYFIPEAPEMATRFTGFKQGDRCVLFDGHNNQFISECTASEFVSELVYWDQQGKMYELYVQARSADFVERP